MSRLMVKELPKQERPLYRARTFGLGALSTSELVQLICRFHYAGTAREVVSLANNLPALEKLSVEELSKVEGVGPAAASAVKAALEIGRRMMIATPMTELQVRSPADAYAAAADEMTFQERERVMVLVLDTRNRVMHREVVYKGSVNTVLTRAAEVFKPAIQRISPAIVVLHNHPSGDTTPSPEDVVFTRSLVEAGKLLDIEVLDHLVVGNGSFTSMKERGFIAAGW